MEGLSEIDDKILSILIRNGRASFASLGEQVGLSAHAAADRVRRLQRMGVITGFAAQVSYERIGRPVDAIVDVRLSSSTSPEEFERFAHALDATREVAFVTGRFDYLVRLACRSIDELDHTVRALRREGGAEQTETRMVMRDSRAGASAAPLFGRAS